MIYGKKASENWAAGDFLYFIIFAIILGATAVYMVLLMDSHLSQRIQTEQGAETFNNNNPLISIVRMKVIFKK